ncbi:MAG TPA: transcription elongation factor GreA [Clostridiales bacterium]|nr:transcription elongation factor GreA [Clostridiales bacterium]
MYDELTEVDIKKMQEEIDYRTSVLGPQLLAEMKRTREFGDLSENAEYKEAKREKRRNEGRIRYLDNMIRTAHIIEVEKKENRAGLFDYVTIYNEARGEEKKIQLVTTLRQDALHGFVSKESPLGSAVMGRQVGERVTVNVAPGRSYVVEIRAIERGEDNEDLPISGY